MSWQPLDSTISTDHRCPSCAYEWTLAGCAGVGQHACPKCKHAWTGPCDERFHAEQPALFDGAEGQLNFVDEIEQTHDADAARELSHEWIGLPMFAEREKAPRVVVSFDSEEDRQRFLVEVGFSTIHKNTRGTLSVWWPPRVREDLASLRFEIDEDEIDEATA